jgi:hypothetical protein
MLSRRRGGPTPKGRVDRAPWVPLGRELLEISEWPSSTGSKIRDSNGTRSKLVVNLASGHLSCLSSDRAAAVDRAATVRLRRGETATRRRRETPAIFLL